MEQVYSATYQPIEDYGVIGDLHTVALVGKNGSIDWCCIPRFDSPSVFGAILDAQKGGFFKIAPDLPVSECRTRQLYFPETNILVTRFLTSNGIGEIIDFMPIQQSWDVGHPHHIIRAVSVVQGSLPFEMVCSPRFNYARDEHTVRLFEHGATFYSKDLCLGLATHVPLTDDGQGNVSAHFTLHAHHRAYFLLECTSESDVNLHPMTERRFQKDFQETMEFWQRWMSKCTYQGRWREMVQRSALVLKLLTYAPTGAIVAAPTTSLPECIGGPRNWDYRFAWLRDAAFTIYGLLTLGFYDETESFMGWLDDRCHDLGPSGSLQPMYGIDGRCTLDEFTLDHLEGYRKSGPVRIGNGAYKQKQMDIYGELIDSIYIFNRHQDISYDLWKNLRHLLTWLEDHWREPDEGIWEVRGGPQPFLHSRVMSWVAFDRALRIARHRGLPAPIADWTAVSAEIYDDIMENGWNADKKSFVQYYGSEEVDASSLLMVLTKFCGPTDPQMLSTLDRIQRELTTDSHVYRYIPGLAASDGLTGSEGTFSPCSFWLVETLARAGRLIEARLVLEKMLSYANHVGLYAEETSPTGEALGNFPQAFTHLALISSCYNLDRALSGTLLG
ncbi:glycoside hydrolase family 15 protein [Dictyobacter formicarum]|uniref:Glucoamylase n=1 Tax=Dictyobacter formicarum TaxID=2778368 RepID=A0ABQ3VL57_9CHLR|nr:glycoside hydrolase family 15 protein [Dictyobacter formicarum]GHO86434.1 glucoamylase [Dictyobacter formicarum]